jgi:hypothetical protein
VNEPPFCFLGFGISGGDAEQQKKVVPLFMAESDVHVKGFRFVIDGEHRGPILLP